MISYVNNKDMITINKWADQLAGDMNRPLDHMLIARLKDLILQEYATLIKQRVDKQGIDDTLKVGIFVPLVKDDSSIDKTTANKKYKTEFRIPSVIRSKTHNNFIYVGSSDGTTPFVRSVTSNRFFDTIPLIGGVTTYDYSDGYITISSGSRIKQIKVVDVFSDLSIVHTSSNIETPLGNKKQISIEYRTDIQLDIPLDIINLVKYKLLNEELKSDSQLTIENTHVDNN